MTAEASSELSHKRGILSRLKVKGWLGARVRVSRNAARRGHVTGKHKWRGFTCFCFFSSFLLYRTSCILANLVTLNHLVLSRLLLPLVLVLLPPVLASKATYLGRFLAPVPLQYVLSNYLQPT
jgi:hypothetical protein